jgi:hypothetical protein
MSTYTFVTKQEGAGFFLPTPVEPSNTSFYQMALYSNPKTKLYHIKRFMVDENDNIIDMKNYNIEKEKYDKIVKYKKPNQYKLYSVFDLKNVGYPSKGDILVLKSNILASNNSYTGYASF